MKKERNPQKKAKFVIHYVIDYKNLKHRDVRQTGIRVEDKDDDKDED